MLNADVTTEGVHVSRLSLKNGKATGSDGILNEMLTIASDSNKTIDVKLFNAILKTGIYPDQPLKSRWMAVYNL